MITEKINTSSSGPASDPPGMLQIANALSTGIAAQTAAYAELSQVLNHYSSSMNDYAKQEEVEGQKMADVQKWLPYVQWTVTALAMAGSFGAAAAPAIAAAASTFGAAGSTGEAVLSAAGNAVLNQSSVLPRVVSTATKGLEGLASAGQSVLQFYQSNQQSDIEKLSTGVETFDKTTEKDSDAIQILCKGAGATGGQINSMVSNEGSVAQRRFT